MRTRLMAAAAALFLALGFGLMITSPAYAGTQDQICTNDGSPPNTCINIWNGGPYFKSWTAGAENNAVTVQGVNRCGNGDLTTSGCAGVPRGTPAGLFTYQIYINSFQSHYSGSCLAADLGVGDTIAGACNNTDYPGTGGATGTIFIADPDPTDCSSGYNLAISNFYTSQAGGWSNLRGISWSTPFTGQPIYESTNIEDCLNYTQF